VRMIYKICSASAWREAERQGVYRGSEDDVRDGFIHFSLPSQGGGDGPETLLRPDRNIPDCGRRRQAGRRAAVGAVAQ